MKRIFIFLLVSISLLLRFSLSIRKTGFQKNEIYKILLNLDDNKAEILRVNDKYPFKHIYAKLFYKENGRYEGYFLIEDMKEEDDFYFMNLKEIKSKKIEPNFSEKYLEKIFERSQKNFSPDLKNMNKAILLGDSNRIFKSMKEKIRYLGFSHIFAMSGLHIGLVFVIFNFITFKIFNKKIYIDLANFIFLTLYYLGVRESPSFTRAYIMICIYLLAKILYEKVSIEKTLLASFIISIFLKPNTIFSLSFQLSYLAMFAIVYFYPLIKKVNVKKWKFLNYTLFTLSIQVFLIPIQVYYFNVFPILSVLANILILPLASIYISLSFLLLFLENFYLGFILSPMVEVIYKIFVKTIDIFSEISYVSVDYYNKNLIYLYIIFLLGIIIKKNKKRIMIML